MFFILKDKTLYPKGYNIACDGDKARFLAVVPQRISRRILQGVQIMRAQRTSADE